MHWPSFSARLTPLNPATRIAQTGSQILLVFLAFVLVAGCASTKKRFAKGVKLEEKGEYREAANYYIQVLEKDPDWEDARERLLFVATNVVEQDWKNAQSYDDVGQSLSAFERYRSVERMIARCENVAVFVPEPVGLADKIAAAEEEAFNELMLRAENSMNEGKYSSAINEYSRARGWSNITREREEAIDIAVARVHLAWGRSEFDREKYGSAFDHADDAIAIVGVDHELGELAVRMQDEAIAEGTRLVAFLSLGTTDEVSRTAPRLFQDDFNDVMLYDFWSQPPPFIATADPILVRRELRRVAGRGTRVLSRGDAIEIGRAVDADFVVAGEITKYDVEDKRSKDETKRVKTRGRNSVDTTYVLRKFTQEKDVKVAYRIYDVRRRTQVNQGSVSAKKSHKLERGIYAGDFSDLDLSGRAYAYFDPEEHELQDQALDEQLADELARKLSDEVYGRILKGLR